MHDNFHAPAAGGSGRGGDTAVPPPGGHWSVIDLGGHECEMHSPPDPPAGRALVYLHGARGRWLREIPALARLVEEHRVPVLAPRTGRSWWLDRIVPSFDPGVTPERFVVETVREAVARRFGVDTPGIALLGTGMGGQGALRIAYRHPAVFPIVAAVAPAIDFHLAMRESADGPDGGHGDSLWQIFGDVEQARQQTAILHVHPLNWPRHQFFASNPYDDRWHDGAARLHGKLVALGIPHEAVLEPWPDGPGVPSGEAANARAIRFVLDAIDQEARRLA